ncbi:MAG TPA: four helix bundle protein [Pirellulales bacterium]|jgi:four helix bundle protein
MADNYDRRFGLDTFELYNCAREFRKNIYKLIRVIHPAERYCLVPQMRRAAISISNNIAEGHGRWHYQENIRFCRIARGSVDEIIDDLNICLDENYADSKRLEELKEEAKTVIARINSYIAYLRRCQQSD